MQIFTCILSLSVLLLFVYEGAALPGVFNTGFDFSDWNNDMEDSSDLNSAKISDASNIVDSDCRSGGAATTRKLGKCSAPGNSVSPWNGKMPNADRAPPKKDPPPALPLKENYELCSLDIYGYARNFIVCDSGIDSNRLLRPTKPLDLSYDLFDASPCMSLWPLVSALLLLRFWYGLRLVYSRPFLEMCKATSSVVLHGIGTKDGGKLLC